MEKQVKLSLSEVLINSLRSYIDGHTVNINSGSLFVQQSLTRGSVVASSKGYWIDFNAVMSVSKQDDNCNKIISSVVKSLAFSYDEVDKLRPAITNCWNSLQVTVGTLYLTEDNLVSISYLEKGRLIKVKTIDKGEISTLNIRIV
jgi:hypothetical protein